MRFSLAAAGTVLGFVLATPLPGNAAGSHFSGPYSSSLMAVQRERQQNILKCARLHPNFDSGTMTYIGRDGRPHRCP